MYSLKDLSEQLWVIDCSKTKMPPDYVVRTKFSDKTANGLTKAIITFLKLHGCQAERISNTGRYIDDTRIVTDVIGFKRKIGSGKYIKGTGTNGTADISATIRGKSVKIEVKIGKDRQSDAQKKYQDDIERAGGLYWIAKDFESFITQYTLLTT
jgi:hypothetical protein